MADDTSTPQSKSGRPQESTRPEPIADPAQPYLAPSSRSPAGPGSLASTSPGKTDVTQSKVAVSAQPTAPLLTLREKHPLAIRWMHWINFPVLFTMMWSGLLIYWGDSIPPYQHPHEVYRIGIGHWTLVRFFPDWFWNLLHAPYQITTGLGWHFFVMWLFAINGVAYAIFLAVSGEWRVLWPKRRSLVDAIWVTLYDLHVPAARRRGLLLRRALQLLANRRQP